MFGDFFISLPFQIGGRLVRLFLSYAQTPRSFETDCHEIWNHAKYLVKTWNDINVRVFSLAFQTIWNQLTLLSTMEFLFPSRLKWRQVLLVFYVVTLKRHDRWS